MKPYKDLSREELTACREELNAEYQKMQEKHLSLDMSRGKPAVTQLDMGMGLLDVLNSE